MSRVMALKVTADRDTSPVRISVGSTESYSKTKYPLINTELSNRLLLIDDSVLRGETYSKPINPTQISG